MDEKKFDSLNLSLEVIKAISDMGFEELSPIQQQAIPLIMDKKDVIGQAQTGTGKTAAWEAAAVGYEPARLAIAAKALKNQASKRLNL